ncbi:glucuronate isomerase [Sphingobacterium sp. DK4209]|uniref:Uronate isomerase n=1 Tax=Sphingobacterium zhuxiongii TaxID=2662364 RepID=A0A5Q0QBN1_9SPHI|nr:MULTISPECIES: glucuronate isomerase [unclassified Sphingobacterium]MVZ66278.1 glucuronate isomerase [Sphingobacterium sp. DK4209]QGA25002.1 glucuronate isomerase [Sphingobacterium sp. dk4302]
MRTFLDDNFLLQSSVAEELYHNYAKDLPIIDYHNHLPPDQVASNMQFENISAIWLHGDHYKWRAMRANGIDEQLITGSASDKDKFRAWAKTVPYTVRNPLYHWTHLELQRYFDIHELLSEKNADRIYEETTAKLQESNYRVDGLLNRMNVEVICTTDDPIDSLEHHKAYANLGKKVKMFPAFRPDKAMSPENNAAFNQYIDKLAEVSGHEIESYQQFLDALKARHDYFAAQGCCVSDHGLSHLYAEDYTESAVKDIFAKIRRKEDLNVHEINIFKSAMLVQFAEWDHEKEWVQQFHVGAFRNTNPKAIKNLGPDTGYDSIGDYKQGEALVKFLSRLDSKDSLGKTILYNLNPMDNELFAAMGGNFNDGKIIGKMQFGSGWWYNDQKDGMTRQITALSNIGLISRFVGMLTDSRSFLSFPRHEYFRRILCDIFAEDIVKGELPHDMEWIGKIVQDICYYNAKAYFPFK